MPHACRGVTKTDEPCKVKIADSDSSDFCRYHKSQENGYAPNVPGGGSPEKNSNSKSPKSNRRSSSPKSTTKVKTTTNKKISSVFKHKPKNSNDSVYSNDGSPKSKSKSKSTTKVKTSTTKVKTTKKTNNSINDSNDTEHYSSKPGYIYCYTLSHLVAPSPEKVPWLNVASGPRTPSLSKNDKENYDWEHFDPKKQIMIKVGVTTNHISKRLQQWKSQCSHDLTQLYPDDDIIETVINSRIGTSIYTIDKLFNKLTLGGSNGRIISELTGVKNKFNFFDSYDNIERGFRCDQAYKAEQSIHQKLGDSYGSGNVLCEACSKSNKDGKLSIHTEWFIIPRTDLTKVFALINEECTKFNTVEDNGKMSFIYKDPVGNKIETVT